MRRQQAGQIPAASCRGTRGGQGVHREMESEGLASKEIPAERVQTHGVCGRHGATEKRLTWGDLVALPKKVFMPRWGSKSRRGRSSYKATPKCSVDAQREV